jgi:hypothetical protein
MSQRVRCDSKIDRRAVTAVANVTSWYLEHVYGRWEGPTTIPFYCDFAKVGHFAVQIDDVAASHPATLFRLFVGLAMFQSQPDQRIMRRQLLMTSAQARTITSPHTIAREIRKNDCTCLLNKSAFHGDCSVSKALSAIDCRHRPRAPCHVKLATSLLRRTGGMGKLPTSAWFHLWPLFRQGALVQKAVADSPNPSARAELVAETLQRVHHVGQKLSTMFVGALSTPSLSPASPWFPTIDGDALVVVDTNVARGIACLDGGVATTYPARVRWVRDITERLRLGNSISPRIVQQALYSFCSRSNRLARGDACPPRCPAPELCPIC